MGLKHTSSLQFKVVCIHPGKSMHAVSHSWVFTLLPLKQSPCWSDGPIMAISSSQGRSLSDWCLFQYPHLFRTTNAIYLAFCPWVVSQAPDHIRFSNAHASHDTSVSAHSTYNISFWCCSKISNFLVHFPKKTGSAFSRYDSAELHVPIPHYNVS